MAATTYKLRLETGELEKWRRAAEAAGLKLAEWVRRRCEGEDANTGSEPKKLRRDPAVRQPRPAAVVERSVPVPAGDPLGPAVPEPAAVGPYVPPFEKFETMSALAKPEHFADCQCGVCGFAREAGLKPALPPKREKKDEKKPAKKSRR